MNSELLATSSLDYSFNKFCFSDGSMGLNGGVIWIKILWLDALPVANFYLTFKQGLVLFHKSVSISFEMLEVNDKCLIIDRTRETGTFDSNIYLGTGHMVCIFPKIERERERLNEFDKDKDTFNFACRGWMQI